MGCKKIFDTNIGPLNGILRGPLESFSGVIHALPSGLVQFGMWIGYAVVAGLNIFMCRYLSRGWRDGEIGIQGCLLGALALVVPLVFAWLWMPMTAVNGEMEVATAGYVATILLSVVSLAGLVYVAIAMNTKSLYHCASDYGLGTALMLAFFIVIVQFAALCLGIWCYHLPGMSATGI